MVDFATTTGCVRVSATLTAASGGIHRDGVDQIRDLFTHLAGGRLDLARSLREALWGTGNKTTLILAIMAPGTPTIVIAARNVECREILITGGKVDANEPEEYISAFALPNASEGIMINRVVKLRASPTMIDAWMSAYLGKKIPFRDKNLLETTYDAMKSYGPGSATDVNPD